MADIRHQRLRWFSEYLANMIESGAYTSEQADDSFSRFMEEWLISH